MAKTQEISVLTVGSSKSKLDLLTPILKHDNVNFSIICSNMLDYDLPPQVEKGTRVWYRDEIRDTLNTLGPEIYSLPDSLKAVLIENDRYQLSENELAINYHINQIYQNTNNLEKSYQLLSAETKQNNVSIYPLVDQNPTLLVFKQKKYAPLRYYLEKSKLLSETPPETLSKGKRKLDDKKLAVENFEYIKTMKLTENGYKALQNSDLIILIPNDVMSFGFLLKATEIDKQLKKLNSPIVLIWQFHSDRKITKSELEVAETVEMGSTLKDFASEIASVTDYIIIDKSEKDLVDELRKYGCHVLVNDLLDDFTDNPQELLNAVFSIGNITDEKLAEEEQSEISETDTDEAETSDESLVETEGEEKKSKPISQLLESPEEAGSDKNKEKPSSDNENGESELEEEPTKTKSKKTQPTKKSSTKTSKQKVDEDEVAELSREEKSLEFFVEEDEEWVDTVARGINLCFNENNTDALQWLSDQSKLDDDNEVQIASEVLKAWLESKSNVQRRKGASILSTLAKVRRDTYLQIMQRQMVTSVIERNEDKRRRLVQIFEVLHDVDGTLAESLISEITKHMAMPSDDKPAILERSKMTIVQLVLHSSRLTKVSINELLRILDKENPSAAQIWNILTTFDAGIVAIELVTNFSTDKASEIIRKANFLRFTGSVYTILQEVLKAWQLGDINAIAEITGTIIPEVTLRKFERLELARKVQKLKMVQLSALAESLNKDVDTVEKLVTELIVNDELQAEMKLVDDKMYLVANNEVSKTDR